MPDCSRRCWTAPSPFPRRGGGATLELQRRGQLRARPSTSKVCPHLARWSVDLRKEYDVDSELCFGGWL
eukprot:3049016-Pyramimonas_sp.AAC.1